MWKILLVDDNFVDRKILMNVLKNIAVFDIAVDGKEAIEAHKMSVNDNTPYDVILLDFKMPETDGLCVLQAIRAYEKANGILLGEGVPIIMVTSFTKPSTDAFFNGCDDYLIKPVKTKDLIEKIQKVVKRS